MEESASDKVAGIATSRIRLGASDLPEELWSPESDEFLYMIETLITKQESRVLSQEELDMLRVLEQRGLGSYGEDKRRECRDYEDGGEEGDSVVAEPAQSEITFMESSAVAIGRQESIDRKRFFGIYPRLQLKPAWRKLKEMGVILRSKRLRLIDIHLSSSSLMTDYERWCRENAMFPTTS